MEFFFSHKLPPAPIKLPLNRPMRSTYRCRVLTSTQSVKMSARSWSWGKPTLLRSSAGTNSLSIAWLASLNSSPHGKLWSRRNKSCKTILPRPLFISRKYIMAPRHTVGRAGKATMYRNEHALAYARCWKWEEKKDKARRKKFFFFCKASRPCPLDFLFLWLSLFLGALAENSPVWRFMQPFSLAEIFCL